MSEFKLLIKILEPEHFDTEVAMEVFGDRVDKRRGALTRVFDAKILGMIEAMSPARLTTVSMGLNYLAFPMMSAKGRREFARIVFESCPHALPQLTHVWPHVRALAAAVSASEHFNAAVLNRLCEALMEK